MSREPRYDDRSARLDEDGRPLHESAPVDRPSDRADERGAGPAPGRRGNWAATAALVCGVASLITLFLLPPLGMLLAPIAVILGIIGLVKARDPYAGGTGQAVAGLVTGVIALLLTALLIWGVTVLFQNEDFQQQLQEQIEQIQVETGE